MRNCLRIAAVSAVAACMAVAAPALAADPDGTGPNDISCGELGDFTEAMAGGAVQNPSGTDGVRLHIDAGRTCPGQTDYDFGGSQHVNIDQPCLNPGHLSQAPFKSKRFKA